MSLFGTLNQSSNALRVAQMGLQVVGNNVANANTPGYLRQELIQAPAPATRLGNLLQGHGVQALGVIQRVDYALVDRLREANSQLAAGIAVKDAYSSVEQMLGALSDNNLDTQLSTFNNTLHDLYNRPQDNSLRELAILRGNQLADNLRQTYERAQGAMAQSDAAIRSSAADVNRLTEKIAFLNRKIVEIEGGRTLGSDATGLRDERLKTVNELGTMLNLTVQEQAGGAVNIFVGGDYLVADGYSREVVDQPRGSGPESGYQLVIKSTGAPLQIDGGTIGGAAVARDEVYGKFLQGLDEIAANIASSFNLIHTQGQGQSGFTDVTGTFKLLDTSAALNQSGMPVTPRDGTFEIQIYDQNRALLKTERIQVSISGPSGAMGIDDVIDQIEAIDGMTAELTRDGELQISAIPGTQFAFANDNSGFLAGIGINTFFTGNTATTLEVNPILVGSPELLAVSQGGLGADTENLAKLVDVFDRFNELSGISARDAYQSLSTQITQNVSVQGSVTEGLQTYQATLEADNLAISGVNIDEEAVKMIAYQRAFQASARVISTVSELLETLVNI